MKSGGLRIVILGLSITSSWGNGHATTFRGLVRELERRGHELLFLERDKPWYAQNRDLPDPPHGRTELYDSLGELHERFETEVRDADLVIVGSFVPEGAKVGDWVQREAGGVSAFYDIDTPVTLAKLAAAEHDYLRPDQIAGYDLYLSFTGGPTLARLEQEYGSPRARVLYCSVDPQLYFPDPQPQRWTMGYLGTYSADRQPPLEELLFEPARRFPEAHFAVGGPQYPDTARWPGNIDHLPHVPPAEHRAFYNSQRFTLNITRADMIAAGWSPSVRLFEAAACGVPIISDRWQGIESVLEPGREILLAANAADVLAILQTVGEEERQELAARACKRILAMTTEAELTPDADTRRRDIEALAPWFHNLHLPGGLQTAPDHFLGGDFPRFKWLQVADWLPQDLTGWKVLDVGCNAGFYSFELAARGASVVAIDVDTHYLAQARWAARQLGWQDRVEFREMGVYDLARSQEQFDLVWFMGVFYHLRYPLLALDLLARRTRRLMMFQTLMTPGEEVYPDTSDHPIDRREPLLDPGWPRMSFIEHSFSGDPTNWWVPNHAGVEAMLRSSGMRITARPGDEIYLCVPDPLGADHRWHIEAQLQSVSAAIAAAGGRTDQTNEAKAPSSISR